MVWCRTTRDNVVSTGEQLAWFRCTNSPATVDALNNAVRSKQSYGLAASSRAQRDSKWCRTSLCTCNAQVKRENHTRKRYRAGSGCFHPHAETLHPSPYVLAKGEYACSEAQPFVAPDSLQRASPAVASRVNSNVRWHEHFLPSVRCSIPTMQLITGTVVGGKIILEGDPLPEGLVVTILARESDETFVVPPELEAELLESIAEADRGEALSADELISRLRRGA